MKKPATKKSKAAKRNRPSLPLAAKKPKPTKANTVTPPNLEPHPFSTLLPPMSAPEFLALKADIAANGQRDPIVLLHGKILDGRHRFRACSELGLLPLVVEYDQEWGEPIMYLYSKAMHRSLNDSQKACAAAKLQPEFAKVAEKRMVGGAPVPQGEAGSSRDQAGELFGVSGRYVQEAKKLMLESPALFDRVFEGDLPITVAKREYERSQKVADLQKKSRKAGLTINPSADWKIIIGEDEFRAAVQLGQMLDAVADLPYNLGFDYGDGKAADSLKDDEYFEWCHQWMELCAKKLADDGSMLVMIDASHQADFCLMLGGVGCDLHWRNTLIWHETFANYTDKNFTGCARYIHYFTKSKKNFTFNADSVRIPSDRQAIYGDDRADPAGKVPGNIWTFPRLVDNAAERIPGFPTQVPVALMERIILACSDPGDLVLDPFNGSGTTGAAALKHGRKYLGYEKVEQNASFARARLHAMEPELKDKKNRLVLEPNHHYVP